MTLMIIGIVFILLFVAALVWLSRLGGKGSSSSDDTAAPGNGTGLFT